MTILFYWERDNFRIIPLFFVLFRNFFIYLMYNKETMSKKLNALIKMIQKIDTSEKLFLGELLIERMRENLNDDEYAEATFTLELQRIKTEILFI